MMSKTTNIIALASIFVISTLILSVVLFSQNIASIAKAGGAFINQLASGIGYAHGYGVTISALDHVTGTGDFADVLNLAPYGGPLLTSTGGQDVYVTRFDETGQNVWGLSFGGGCANGNCDDQGRSIVQDTSGNFIVTGHYVGPLTYGSTMLPSYGGKDIFIAKFDQAGGLLWMKSAGSMGEDFGRDISVDSNNNVYVTGALQGKTEFDSMTIMPSGTGRTAFLAKYDASGNLVYVKIGDGMHDGYGTSVAINAQDDVIWSTLCYGDVTFDSVTLTGGSSYDVCIVKHDSTGTLQWALREGGTLEDEAKALAVDMFDNIIVTGRFRGNPLFSGQALTGHNWWYNSFVAKYDTAGTLQWVKQSHIVHEPAGVHANAASIYTPMRDVIRIAGHYGGEVLFDSTPFPVVTGNDDAFIVELDGNGTVTSTEFGFGNNADTVYDLANHDSSDRTAFTGNFFGDLTFTFMSSLMMNAGATADAIVGSY